MTGDSNDVCDLFDRGLIDAGISSWRSNAVYGNDQSPIDHVANPRLSFSVAQLMEEFAAREECVKISAPMVRYSKLAFRRLVRKYGVDLCFTPMIVADAFINSIKGMRLENSRHDKPFCFAGSAIEFHKILFST